MLCLVAIRSDDLVAFWASSSSTVNGMRLNVK